MAHTQTPDELRRPKAQTKKTQSTPDKLRSGSSAAQQNGKGRGGIAKKETPNYMKSTTCSDARKDPMQVSAQSPAPATVVKARNHADQSNSKPSLSSSPSLPVAKHLKTLARKASLRPRRPSMKKIHETSVLSPRRKVSRATCSSTMKESKFPNVSEVNPGNEDAALTSAVKVCPFNYCSLHGRRHQHLQPLRRLPSARRRSFRTQRSVKLRRVSSIRRRSFKKGGRSMNSGKMRSIQGSKIAPVIEETNYDFLNEIYKDEFDREISKFLESLEPSGDDTEFSEEEIEEFEGEGIYIEIPEQHGLEESKSAIGDGSHTSKGHSFVAENGGGDVTSPHRIIFGIVADDADHGDDKHEETDESGSDELEEKNISSESQTIEQVVEDESTSEQSRSVVADEHHSNKSEQDGFGKAKLVTDDEDDDNSNISNGGEDDRTEGRNAERSKLAAAEEWPENKEPEITSGYENPDSSLKLIEEEKVRDGRFIENQGFWDSDFIDLSEGIYSEDDQTWEHDQTGTIFAAICTQNGMITSSEGARCNQSAKLSNKQKARRRSVKWKKDIEMEVLRLINPRAPRFLPVEPNPAAETVDLRHQQGDERKSSETWMIDNALQKTVRKLTPARSKKVALLVEAFETVMSVPIHDLTLKSPTSDLGRPVQACR